MYKSSSSRVVPIILLLIVVAIAVAALVSVGRAVFGGNSSPQTEQVDMSEDNLLNTAVSRSVRMTIRGPIVADENFRSYQVTVSPTTRTLVTYSGYLDQVIERKDLSNNSAAYTEFVFALNRANMVNGTPLEGEKNDTRGVCATGNVYSFETLNDSQSTKQLWTSTCSGSKGSFKASVPQVQNLFLEQVPDASKLLRTIGLS